MLLPFENIHYTFSKILKKLKAVKTEKRIQIPPIFHSEGSSHRLKMKDESQTSTHSHAPPFYSNFLIFFLFEKNEHGPRDTFTNHL